MRTDTELLEAIDEIEHAISTCLDQERYILDITRRMAPGHIVNSNIMAKAKNLRENLAELIIANVGLIRDSLDFYKEDIRDHPHPDEV